MRICVHRGAHQIGGNCVELEHEGYPILLDLGLPLGANGPDIALQPSTLDLDLAAFSAAASRETLAAAPDAQSLSPLKAVVVSHIHPDHIGLTGFVRANTLVKRPPAAESVKDFLPWQVLPQNLEIYADRRPFLLGPFEITPFLVDHSAFDAYAFLIEAGGRRVFYSGDLRAHGRKGTPDGQTDRRPPPDIDVLLLEGTTLSRGGHRANTEAELENEIHSRIAAAPGLVAVFSAQNVDRFVTFFKATLRAGRIFVGDAYLAHLLRALRLPSLPRPDPLKFR